MIEEALYVAGGSAVVLLALVFLFSLEARRGERLFLGGVRSWCDRGLDTLGTALTKALGGPSGGTLRATFHYLLHQVLGGALAVVNAVESALAAMQRRNKRAARHIQNGTVTQSHLTELQSHKEATALTPAQKRKRVL